MEPVLLGPPRTPSRATSAGPSPSQRSSMEDADSSVTRKRPRLDSGDRAYRSMSAEALRATAPPGHSTPSKGELGDIRHSTSQEPDYLSPPNRTPSKVTINVRDPIRNGRADDVQRQTNTLDLPETADKFVERGPDSDPPNAISISSSPTRSPEIEVAEVEDMDEDTGVTKWRPLISVVGGEGSHEALLDSFPFALESNTLMEALAFIAQAFEKGNTMQHCAPQIASADSAQDSLGDGSVLRLFAEWIERYLQVTEQQSARWWDFYTEEREFWEEIPYVVECLLRRGTIPFGCDLIRPLRDIPQDTDRRHYFQQFFDAYAALTARMVHIDCQTLVDCAKEPNVTPDLISKKYLVTLAWFPSPNVLPLWKLLYEVYGDSHKRTVAAIIFRFTQQSTNGFRYLSRFVQGILDRLQIFPNLLPLIWPPIRIVSSMAHCCVYLQDTSQSQEDLDAVQPLLQNVPSEALLFFQAVDETLQHFVTKQVSALSLELSKTLVVELTAILRNVVMADSQLARTLYLEKFEEDASTSSEVFPAMVELNWKFELLKKCIVGGRMEIRVQGVDTMQQELVRVYNKYLQNDKLSIQHPVVRYLSDFVLVNRLVDYIVGVESHPQLITRSANIVGFLVVTRKYTERESDAIWKTVSASQDPRVVDATLSMLTGIFNIANYPHLLYLCRKLIESPLQAFDSRMITYAKNLLENLRIKWNDLASEQKLDMQPYNLCIRLIRQAAADDGVSLPRKSEIYQFALVELRELMVWGPNDADRKSIYEECLNDISKRTMYATGSISAVNALLGQDTGNDIKSLATNSDFSRLTVDEFTFFAEMHAPNATALASEAADRDSLSVRLDLLQRIIVYIPETITGEVGQQLWDTMFGHRACSNRARDLAWTMLVRIVHHAQARNSFIDRCTNEFLPLLRPQFFTQGILQFLHHILPYESRLATSQAIGEHQIIAIPGEELLWHVSAAAPDSTIEVKTIQMLVLSYLDSQSIQDAPKSAVDATHVGLVERCIHQLTAAAQKLKAFSDGTTSGEDEPMVIVASEEEVRVERLRFTRSLLLLREFLRAMKAHPHYSSPQHMVLRFPESPQEVNGESIRIRYQAFSGGSNTGIQTIDVGDLETGDSFVARLVKLTGFTKFTAIAAGQKLDLSGSGSSTLRDLKLDQKGLLIVKRAQDAQPVQEPSPAQGLTELEIEIMKHFEEIYNLLDMEDRLARDVFEFLISFPPHETITTMVSSHDISIETAFPIGNCYKILYSVYTLRLCLNQHLQNGTANQQLILHGVQVLGGTLMKLSNLQTPMDQDMETATAAGVVDCLLRFLKEPVSPETSALYFSDASAFVERLRGLIATTKSQITTADSVRLVRNSFSAILEAALHSGKVWASFKDHTGFTALLRELLLEDLRHEIRQGVADAIRGVCGTLPTSTETPTQDFVSFFWQKLLIMIPQSVKHPDNAQQLYDIALVVFRSIRQGSQDPGQLATYAKVWGNLLLEHIHDEFVGRDNVDWIVLGLSGLLRWCIQLIKSMKKPLETGDFMERLFYTHLFPTISSADDNRRLQARVPALHSQTRQELYSIILALSNDLEGYRKLLSLVREVLPQGESSCAWSWGIAQTSEDYRYESNWNFERTKLIRSPTGYAGLKNLSNTCYLNSLFTQLFMNVSFRSFMLDANVADGDGSQRLLSETKKVFAQMQETWLKMVDPQGIADSCTTYDNTLIDTSVQMDVDEFYNLLFDRWEGQILSAEAKKTFRAFYGGQLVQQIKSKECPHISERLEPFSAIQCDIQGKANLVESLTAYVEGEIMEGDNKYSCTSCGCYVDAVKRACLKDIPDNLIFHLKRFDYDVMTGVRSKINDRFDFPEEVDMAPYNVEHLRDPSNPSPSDQFRLVGVLVHSGTAESGHYYSYIRERPINATQGQSWVEYNDADVTRFDPSNIPDQCFGGMNDAAQNTVFSHVRFPKAWNAYMLFYQRVTAMEAEYESHQPMQVDIPVKESLPLELSNRIAIENELWIRKYCLFDPAHAQFAKSVLEQLRYLSNGTCSDNHDVEKEAIWLALEHLDQVLSKPKDCADFENMLSSLARVIGSCAECCKLALDWVVEHKHALRNLLLRSPTAKVRRDFARMILSALQYLRKHDARLYGFDVDDADTEPLLDGPWPEIQGSFQYMVQALTELWTCLHMHARAWDDYFGLLADMAKFGAPESYILLREGVLRHCLEILIIESPGAKRLRTEYPYYANYLRLIEKGRKYSFTQLIELMRVLFAHLDLDLRPVDVQIRARPQSKGRSPLSKFEEDYVRYGADLSRPKSIVFLDKMLGADQNPMATRAILAAMIQAEPGVGLLASIYKTIISGINIEPASLAAPYLRAALVFCEYSPAPPESKELVRNIAREVETIGHNGGKEHLEFFVQARRMRNVRYPRNPHFFNRLVLVHVHLWAPPLLMYWEECVRADTINLLKTLVFDHDIHTMENEQEADELNKTARHLCQMCIKRVQEQVVQAQKTVESKSMDNVVDVIKHCLQHYYQPDTVHEDAVIVEQAETVLEHLYTLTVSDADDALSDGWNNDSDINTDSESEFMMLSP